MKKLILVLFIICLNACSSNKPRDANISDLLYYTDPDEQCKVYETETGRMIVCKEN